MTVKTQDWVDVERIEDGLVVLKDGHAAAIVEVRPVNFTMLSVEEQDAKLAAYRGFLNALPWPVQIVSTSEVLRMDGYFAALDQRAAMASDAMRLLMVAQKTYLQGLIHEAGLLARRYFAVVWMDAPARKGARSEQVLHSLRQRHTQLQAALANAGLSCSIPDRASTEAVVRVAYGLTACGAAGTVVA